MKWEVCRLEFRGVPREFRRSPLSRVGNALYVVRCDRRQTGQDNLPRNNAAVGASIFRILNGNFPCFIGLLFSARTFSFRRLGITALIFLAATVCAYRLRTQCAFTRRRAGVGAAPGLARRLRR